MTLKKGVTYLGACQCSWISDRVSALCVGKTLIKVQVVRVKHLICESNRLVLLPEDRRFKYEVTDTHSQSESSQMCSYCRKTADTEPRLSCVVAVL